MPQTHRKRSWTQSQQNQKRNNKTGGYAIRTYPPIIYYYLLFILLLLYLYSILYILPLRRSGLLLTWRIQNCTYRKSEEIACCISAFCVVAVLFLLSGWKQNGVVSPPAGLFLGVVLFPDGRRRSAPATERQSRRRATQSRTTGQQKPPMIRAVGGE